MFHFLKRCGYASVVVVQLAVVAALAAVGLLVMSMRRRCIRNFIIVTLHGLILRRL